MDPFEAVNLFMSQKPVVNEWLADASFKGVGEAVFLALPSPLTFVQVEARWQ